jgi:polysaccharide pyruvyl transferase WcaK-like protein
LKVLLIGHYGKGNLGDDAMLAGIRKAFPDEHELRVVASRPVEGLKTYQQRPLELLRAGLECDWIWMGGGSIIHDEGTNPRFKHRGLMQAVVVFFLAVFTRCQLAYIGMGLGPLRHRWKRRVVAFLFQQADYVSLRDSASVDEWRRCDPSNEHLVHRTFDSCVALQTLSENRDPDSDEISERPCFGGTEVGETPTEIGLNIMPYFRVYEDDPERDEHFLNLIVDALRKSLADGTTVRLFTFNKKDEESEQVFIDEAGHRLSDFVDTDVLSYSTPQHTLEEIERCDAMIAMRYHGSMMAYLAGVPQVVLGYHEKCIALARDIGCSPCAIIDIRHLHSPDSLAAAVRGVQRDPTAYCASLPVSTAHEQFESSYFPLDFVS